MRLPGAPSLGQEWYLAPWTVGTGGCWHGRAETGVETPAFAQGSQELRLCPGLRAQEPGKRWRLIAASSCAHTSGQNPGPSGKLLPWFMVDKGHIPAVPHDSETQPQSKLKVKQKSYRLH